MVCAFKGLQLAAMSSLPSTIVSKAKEISVEVQLQKKVGWMYFATKP